MSDYNQQVATTQKQFSPLAYFQSESVKNKFAEILGQRSVAYVTSVLALVNQNDKIQKCTGESVYMCSLMAASLDLPINPNLGFAYIIPYGNVASFQISYKGLIQLAMRTGLYKTISSCPIYEGQLKAQNPLTGFEFDFSVLPNGNPIGYAAYFELLTGFSKTFYMTANEVLAHAKKYSKTFNSGPWQTDREAMSLKTVLKLLLGKFAPMTTDLGRAIVADQAVIKNLDTMEVEYPDNDKEPVEPDEKQAKANACLAKVTAELVKNKTKTPPVELVWGQFSLKAKVDCQVTDMELVLLNLLAGDVLTPSQVEGVWVLEGILVNGNQCTDEKFDKVAI